MEVLEKLLDKGVVIAGDLILSCANVDLVYVDLRLVVTSVQTMLDQSLRQAADQPRSHQPAVSRVAVPGRLWTQEDGPGVGE